MDDPPGRVQKAFAYIGRGSEVLVFRHVDFPEAGLQVPAGTVQPGEMPAAAVLREAREETGLDGLVLVRRLGTLDFDMRPFGMNQIHERWFYLLTGADNAPDSWIHHELHGGDHPIAFAFTWEPIAGLAEQLIAGHGALLHLAGE